jgi:hypothetical protein
VLYDNAGTIIKPKKKTASAATPTAPIATKGNEK